MKSITQEDPFGCSLACIAHLTGNTYKSIIQLVDDKKARNGGFYCKELVSLLSNLGYSYSYKYLKPRFKKLIYHDDAIVFIKRSKQYPSGHYLVRSGDMWMDPWINFSVTAKISDAESGFRKRLPGIPIYGLFP